MSQPDRKPPTLHKRGAHCVVGMLMWGERHLITWHERARKLVSRPEDIVKGKGGCGGKCGCRAPMENGPPGRAGGPSAWGAC